jgi:hypothetical protein
MHSSWTIPREVMDVLAKHLGLQHDRLATPLTYDINMQHYWSNHERDQLLGASWQPYAHQWRGYSQCNPTLDHADMEKAVRWALLSAKQAAGHPTCTVFVLPGGHKSNQNTAYRKWLAAEPSYCFTMAHIKDKYFRYCTPEDQYHGAPYTGRYKSTETIVLLVANPAAYHQLDVTMDFPAYTADIYGAGYENGGWHTRHTYPAGGAQPGAH